RLRDGARLRPAGQAARRAAHHPGRRPTRRSLRRSVGRPSRTCRRSGHSSPGAGRHGRRAAAGRLLFPARDAEAADRSVAQAWRGDRDLQRFQSRHLAAHLAAADPEHGGDLLPAHRGRMPARRDAPRRESAGPARPGRQPRSRQVVRSGDLGHRAAGRAGLPHRLHAAASADLEGPMKPGAMTLGEWRAVYRGAVPSLDPACVPAIERSAAAVSAIIAKVVPAAKALADAGLKPLTLGAKEGLALLNGTQFSTAYALAALFETETLFQSALVTGALSTDAARGSDAPFDPRIHRLRRHRGQIETAEALRELMKGSAIRASHLVGDERVQDPYCLRCQPQVMGAVLDLLRHAAQTVETEANGVTDNPLIFADTEEALSGGNFHAEPVAFAADTMALAICEIGSLAERRIAMLVDPALSGLPAFLTPRPGLNSGFMIPQVTA